MKIIKIKNKEILKLKPLWGKLNAHHWQRSTYFKKHFESFTFEKRIRQLDTKDAFAVFIAEEEADIIGYCIASVKERNGEIDSIFVTPQYRKTRIGKRLFEKAESWLREMGASKIFVYVAEGNESVFEFYNRLGYFQKFTVLEKETG